MKHLVKMAAFHESNQETLTELEMAQIKGGKAIGSSTTQESYGTNDSGCSDTENWVYDESGQKPISGIITYSDGTYNQVYP